MEGEEWGEAKPGAALEEGGRILGEKGGRKGKAASPVLERGIE